MDKDDFEEEMDREESKRRSRNWRRERGLNTWEDDEHEDEWKPECDR